MTRMYQFFHGHRAWFLLTWMLGALAVILGLETFAGLPSEQSVMALPVILVLMLVFMGLIFYDDPRQIVIDGGEVTIISANSFTNKGQRYHQARLRAALKSPDAFLLLHGERRVAIIRRRNVGDLEWEELAGYFGLGVGGARAAESYRHEKGMRVYELEPRSIKRPFRYGMIIVAVAYGALGVVIGGDPILFLLMAGKAAGIVLFVARFRIRRDVHALEVTPRVVEITRVLTAVPLPRHRRYLRDQLSFDATDTRIRIRYKGKIVGVVHAETMSAKQYAEIRALLTGQADFMRVADGESVTVVK